MPKLQAILGIWWITLASGLVCTTAQAADASVTVQYRDKPPYSYTRSGKPVGFLMERTIEIFRQASVTAVYEEVPVKRITRDIQNDGAPICSPGWYKLPERELYALFSLPIHEDKPHLVLVGVQSLDKIRLARNLREIFANPDLKLGKVSGTSYGAELDAMISNTAQTAMDSTVTPLAMAKMIKFKRADYMLIDEEDYSFLNQQGEVDAADVRPVRFTDMPPGLKRYIMCSKSVGADTMARINAAIKTMTTGVKP
jgi:polar amino acid transport system substrate-binding protein